MAYVSRLRPPGPDGVVLNVNCQSTTAAPAPARGAAAVATAAAGPSIGNCGAAEEGGGRCGRGRALAGGLLTARERRRPDEVGAAAPRTGRHLSRLGHSASKAQDSHCHHHGHHPQQRRQQQQCPHLHQQQYHHDQQQEVVLSDHRGTRGSYSGSKQPSSAPDCNCGRVWAIHCAGAPPVQAASHSQLQRCTLNGQGVAVCCAGATVRAASHGQPQQRAPNGSVQMPNCSGLLESPCSALSIGQEEDSSGMGGAWGSGGGGSAEAVHRLL